MSARISKADASRLRLPAAPKASKYGNKRVQVDGRKYASKREAEVCEGYIRDEKAGLIGGLELQKRFPLLGPKGGLICVYIADAAFWDHQQDRFRVVDIKGVETEVFKLKRKMMRELKGIEVEIIR